MVAQRSLSLYELLEVSSDATFEEIEQAYQRIAAYLGPESLAVYSMLDSADAAAMRTQLDEAYRTLSDPDRRAAYDRARKEDQNYPPLMVPAHSGDSTASVGRVHQESSIADKAPRAPDDAYAIDRSDARGAWPAKEDTQDKHLPVRGRGQQRPPIRGPGSRTGRTPLYGRDVPMRDPAELGDASDVKVREQQPRYGRAAPPIRNNTFAESPRAHSNGPARPQYGRWSTREDEDGGSEHGQGDTGQASRERPSDVGGRGSELGGRPSEVGDRGSELGGRPSDSDLNTRLSDPSSEQRPRPADPRSSDLWAPDLRTDSRTWSGSHDVEYRAPEPEPRYPEPRIVDPRPPEPRFTDSRPAERPPEPRVETRPQDRMPEGRPPNLPQRFSDVRIPEPVERPELIKTVSDVVEPRQRSTIPSPVAMSASAKPKRRILSPSALQEITPETEFGGGFLRKLRESTGATLDEVAEITKVSKRYLIAIETNDFAAMPAAVYTRGFVVEYARVLGLDPQPVAKSFMVLYAKHRGMGG